MKQLIFALLCAVFVFGCVSYAPKEPVSSYAGGENAPLSLSLFGSDTAILSNEAVAEILRSKVQLSPHMSIAILKIPGSDSFQRYYGYYYWRSERYMDTQERLNKTLTGNLGSNRISNIRFLPSLLIPEKITIPLVREAATRLQAQLIIVYKMQSNIFEEYRLFQGVKIRSYANCEYILLDTKTGIILLSDVITKKLDTEKLASDLTDSEAFLRAETEVSEQSLVDVAKSIVAFIDSGV